MMKTLLVEFPWGSYWITLPLMAVVWWHVFKVAAAVSWVDFDCRFRDYGFRFAFSLLAVGALAVVLQVPHGGVILLLGVAMMLVFDRRKTGA
jgi:hypothetical protein